MDELLKAGERIANIRQAFNVREGLNPFQFDVPGRMVGKPKMGKGPLGDITVDEDPVNGISHCHELGPQDRHTDKDKLLELGMEDVAKTLWP